MATSTKRNNPVRTTNNNGAAVRTPATRFNAKHYSSTIKTLRQIGKRGTSIADHSTKTYDEIETIAQTVDALACKIQDGQISANQIVLALEKIESRLHAVNGRINYAEMNICTLAGDAEWVADGNNNDD